jgi:hypothetical protein
MTKFTWTAMVAVGLMTLAACSKDDVDGDTTTTTTSVGDGDGDGDSETSTTSPGDGDGDPTTSTSTTSGFVPEDVAAQNSCDPWANDCPEGEKCAAWNSGSGTWDANKCVPINGDGQEGDACTYDGAQLGTDTCDIGHMCYYTDTEGQGSCIPLCTGTPDNGMCPTGYNCSISNTGSLLLCVYSCDPILQDCAIEDTGCFWDGAFFNCDPAGELLTNDPCGYINDCSAGHLCADAESLPSCNGSACCASFCDLSNPSCSVTGTECVAFFEEGTAPPGLGETGVCVLPGT